MRADGGLGAGAAAPPAPDSAWCPPRRPWPDGGLGAGAAAPPGPGPEGTTAGPLAPTTHPVVGSLVQDAA